jgi:hypothetical protein
LNHLDLTPGECDAEFKRRFPIIFRDCYLGAYPPPGWRQALFDGFAPVEELAVYQVNPLQVVQVKSKMSTCRVYHHGATTEQRDLIVALESRVSLLCEWCGSAQSEVRATKSGVVVRDCDECRRLRG